MVGGAGETVDLTVFCLVGVVLVVVLVMAMAGEKTHLFEKSYSVDYPSSTTIRCVYARRRRRSRKQILLPLTMCV